MLKRSPNEKDMVYGPNGKGIMASMKYILKIYSPHGKGMHYKQMHYKRYNVNQNQFYALQKLHYVNKSKVTIRNFIWLIFLAPFYFSLLLSIGKRSTLASPVSTGLKHKTNLSYVWLLKHIRFNQRKQKRSDIAVLAYACIHFYAQTHI